MTPSQQLQEIKEACIAANKEIMELKFGCEILCNDYSEFPNERRMYAGKIYNPNTDHMENRVEKSGKLYKMDIKYEILGRPIRQDDCALVIKNKHGLADRWTNGYLQDQTAETIDWIVNNMVVL